jgi:predicted dithiol-disulfide oxidoreductase (DUF899 family)
MTGTKSEMKYPKIVDQAEWQKARDALLVKEKALMQAHDALAAERRRLPMVKIEKQYSFDGPNGTLTVLDLFEGRRQLLLYHFMFAPPVGGWPDAGCVGCSMVTDTFGRLEHFHARDTTFCLVSRAPLEKIEKYKKRMEWRLPWYSSEHTDFNQDFGLTKEKSENYGLSAFIRDDDKNVYRTYFTDGRGVEGLNFWPFMDLTPLGRQEDWEDSPAGYPQTKKSTWWRRHDEYGKQGAQEPGEGTNVGG